MFQSIQMEKERKNINSCLYISTKKKQIKNNFQKKFKGIREDMTFLKTFNNI